MPYYLVSFILLLITMLIIGNASAEDSSDIDSSVTSLIDIRIIDGSSFSVSLSADVNFITLPANEKQYTKEDIQSASPEMLGAIKYALKTDCVSQIRSSFPGCDITSLNELPHYEDGMFYDEYEVNLSADFFSLNESVSSFEVINGLLDAGVFVNYSFPWTALNGWNNTYTLILSDPLSYKQTNGDVHQKRISWDVLNGEGLAKEKEGTITLKDLSPTTDPSQNETVSLLFSLDCKQAKYPTMNVNIQAHRLDMGSYSCIPSVFAIPASIPADAIRLCALNNLTSWDELKQLSFLMYEQDAMNALVESSFNQSFNASFIWDEATTINCSSAFTLGEIDETPPVIGFIQDDNVTVQIHSISAQAFFGLMNAGGHSTVTFNDVNFANVFDDVNMPASSELLLPDHVLCNGSNKVSWIRSTDFYRMFSSKNSPEYDSPQISQEYHIGVKNTDLNLLSFFSGKTEVNMGISFEKNRYVSVMKRSPELFIPPEINLSFINADAFRLCVDEKVFSSDEIDAYINHHEIVLENTSRRLFPSIKGSAVTETDVFEDSLVWDKNISMMDAEDPVVFHQCMESTAPLSCSFSVFPPQFSFATQNLTFVGVAEETVTYNMSFPKGITVNVLSSSQPIVQQVSSDGNALLSVRLNASEEGKVINVLISMQPSALYILGLFVPCIISVVITFILFIVVFIIRKKRNLLQKGKQEPHHQGKNDGYENEEYYVPPKPPSSR